MGRWSRFGEGVGYWQQSCSVCCLRRLGRYLQHSARVFHLRWFSQTWPWVHFSKANPTQPTLLTQPNLAHCLRNYNPTQPMDWPNPWPCLDSVSTALISASAATGSIIYRTSRMHWCSSFAFRLCASVHCDVCLNVWINWSLLRPARVAN